MDPKTYEKLQRVNYNGATCIVTPLTVTADFMEYESVWARLHQFFLHDWGVASGLEVLASPGAANLQVQAGIAVDRRGNLIVLSTGGSGMLGDIEPLTEASVPVAVPTSDLISQKYMLTIQAKETHRQVASPPDFFCGKQEQTPQLRMQPVIGFRDSDDYVCLAVVELDAGGVVKSINAQDGAAPLGRRLLGETVGAVRFQASTGSNPVGTVQDVLAAAVEPLPAGNGLKVTSALTALTGKLCIAPTSATPPADVPGSLVVMSNTPGGGGGVKTLDGNGKVLVALTSTGTGGQQAGYASVGTAAGTEIVSLSASASGAGQVQVQTRAGKAAIVLNTVGAGDDGVVHVLSNDQDVVTLGPAGISSKGNISTEGAISSQGITTGTMAVQQGLTAGSIASQGAITAQGTITAQNNIATRGSVSCTFVQGQGWSAASGAISGSGWSLSAGGVAGSGWSHSAGGVSGSGWNLSAGGLSTGGWINTTQVVKAEGGAVVKAGVWTDGNLQCGGQVFANGWINTPLVVKADGGAVVKAGVWTDGNLQCGGQVIAQGEIFGKSKHFIMPHPTDDTKEIVYASIEGPESAAYVRGRATLKNGKAQVEFPEHFVVVVNGETLTIQLTPRSAASKGLAIVESGSNGFSVQELFDGAGSYDFDYFVSGVRRGYEDYQPVVAKGYSPMKRAGGEAMMLAAMPAPAPASSMFSMPAPEVTPAPEPTSPRSMQSMEPTAKPEPWDLL